MRFADCQMDSCLTLPMARRFVHLRPDTKMAQQLVFEGW